MAHDTSKTCPCVADHRPPYLELELHHVWPRYLGSPEDSETVAICSTTHTSIHELLRLMLRAGRPLTYHQCQQLEDRPVSRYAHGLAVEGYRRWAATQA
jgi:hypothetical protein